MKAKYNGCIYDVANCDFEDYTVGLLIAGVIVELPFEKVEIVKID